MLPMARSAWPRSAAVTVTDSSGRLVPTAMIVNPITCGLTWNLSAIDVADSTKAWLDNSNTAKPARNHTAALGVAMSGKSSTSLCSVSGKAPPLAAFNRYSTNAKPPSSRTPSSTLS